MEGRRDRGSRRQLKMRYWSMSFHACSAVTSDHSFSTICLSLVALDHCGAYFWAFLIISVYSASLGISSKFPDDNRMELEHGDYELSRFLRSRTQFLHSDWLKGER